MANGKNEKAARLAYAREVLELQRTVGETGYAFHQLGEVEKDKDQRAPLRRLAEDLIRRHNFIAARDNPIPAGESGRMRCGCMDCQLAAAALGHA